MANLTKHRVAYEALRERILDGTFGPGYRIVIDAVARELGVSAVPVREAVRQLEAEGWLTYEPNVGARVMPLDADQWEQTMSTLAVLEGRATALSAPLLRSRDLSNARKLNREMRTALRSGDPLTYTRLNVEFHGILMGQCKNDHLMRLIRQTNDRLNAMRRSVFLFIPMRGSASIEEHETLVKMISSHESEAEIEAFARAHKLRTVEAFLEVLHRPRQPLGRMFA